MDDRENLLRIFSDQETMRYYPSTKNEEEAERWIRWTLDNYASHGIGLWMFETKERSEFVGQAGIVPQYIDGKEETEIGYLFVREHWGKGFATEATNACKDYGIRSLRLHRFVSIIHPENRRSIAVAERMGMTFEREVQFHGTQRLLYSVSC